jgi:peptidoglycan/xylan/chitin deacetylase (PgdA/CDA1 family)
VKTGEQTGYAFNASGEHSFLQDFSVRQLTNTLVKTGVRHITFQLTSTGTPGAEIWVKEVRYGVRTHPSIVFYFDDQHITQYTVAKPILDRYGLKSTICVSGDALINNQASGIYMTQAQLQEMYDDGHEIVSHSWAHGSYGGMTYQQIYDDAQRNQDLITSRGWYRNGSEKLMTYPNGSAPTEANMGALTSLGYTYGRGSRTYNVERYQQQTYGGVDYPMRLLTWGLSRPPRTITAMANNGSGAYRITAASHGFSSDEIIDISGTGTTADGTWPIIYVSSSQFDLVGPSFASNATGTARQSRMEWERRVHMAIRFGATCHVLVHQVGAGGISADVGYVTDVEFDPFIQTVARLVSSNVLSWRTMPEWVNGLTHPRRRRVA